MPNDPRLTRPMLVGALAATATLAVAYLARPAVVQSTTNETPGGLTVLPTLDSEVAPMVLDHWDTATTRALKLLCSGVFGYLVIGVSLWVAQNHMASLGLRFHVPLTISHSTGIDFLAAIGTAVIALNVSARLTGTAEAPDVLMQTPEARARAYARHFFLSNTAELMGFASIVIGCASFADAINGNAVLAAFAVLSLAIVISLVSLDAKQGLYNGDAIRREVVRAQRNSDVERLRRVTADTTPPPPWSAKATQARYPATSVSSTSWWVYEILATVVLALLGPATVVAVQCWFADNFDGYWSGLALLSVGVLLLILTFSGSVVALAFAVIARPTPLSVVLSSLVAVALLIVAALPIASYLEDARRPDDLALAVAGVWTIFGPICLTVCALAIQRERASWLPTGLARATVRSLILGQIKRLESLLGVSAPTPPTVPTAYRWWHVWAWPHRASAAVHRWYQRSAGRTA
ncbi:hypothetical protein [Nocardia camponoti]|uniref:Uncharacterized protein n=1 Tax=Nocardia camponoti TaxID=1616106 RepID=A0A917Q9I4_9NOCA|nr:hypothetical protein [Nocardia camponoti]GGK34225.1 hypothetical protein GCM10011591_02440 [Nocardia camponoti]